MPRIAAAFTRQLLLIFKRMWWRGGLSVNQKRCTWMDKDENNGFS